ncbi:MAG TPA: type II toxin-antitoxin system HicA family toxin [Bacteroidales bacterium]|jgi:predicted RNA binding protein YcfA (HicA-like mRNA interferase family)|nr:addiction module toxin, HicA family [Bacteroidales bacterium]HPM03860.1 type II toxin-antitoxin system HicA family toxin [Candidatus Cloacimonadota bacterium]NLK55732.1 type II toxin-antitoxin system HicA family toxin [Bacteroidales bacterium]HNY52295.1 type II toxin-antitoxin system HicA family toxin [Bacteroidales bacterium]HOG57242.1 type II toxin-antitoxin system HicA family toxin [Bacteroidales bacterium]
MKISDLIEILKDDGWTLVRIKGSHRQFKHRTKKGLVTVSGKLSDDIKKGTLGSVLRQAGLK